VNNKKLKQLQTVTFFALTFFIVSQPSLIIHYSNQMNMRNL